MRTKKIVLGVDVVGGLGALTAREEASLREYFKKRKESLKKHKKPTSSNVDV